MHDIRFVRENQAVFDRAMQDRGAGKDASAPLIELDQKRRQAQTELGVLQSKRNRLSREIGEIKSKGGDATSLMDEVTALKGDMAALTEAEHEAGEALNHALSILPNLPMEDVPVGEDESANREIRTWGTATVGKPGLQHFEIGENLGLMDFETAARMSGARFVLLRGVLARLERALASFMLDIHTTENGYTEISPPLMVRDEAMYGTGQLPKFGEDMFRTEDGFWLVPTAEVPLTNCAGKLIIDPATLPWRLTAWTPCFRSEAGAAGRDTRGMIRMHQFSKVELVSITTSEQSMAEHERMTASAEKILQRLNLPYRVIVLSTGDMGFGARKTYDIEVWLPGQQQYREISSCSNCGDFQARRMNARMRQASEKGTKFVHSLNGSGLAVGRTLIGVLENYVTDKGDVVIPEALRPYMGGLDKITKESLGSAQPQQETES